MSIRTYPYDTAEFLLDDEEVALFAETVLEDGDPGMYRRAIDVVARAHGFTRLAQQAGIPRAQLIDALRAAENDGSGALKAALVAASLPARREAAE